MAWCCLELACEGEVTCRVNVELSPEQEITVEQQDRRGIEDEVTGIGEPSGERELTGCGKYELTLEVEGCDPYSRLPYASLTDTCDVTLPLLECTYERHTTPAP